MVPVCPQEPIEQVEVGRSTLWVRTGHALCEAPECLSFFRVPSLSIGLGAAFLAIRAAGRLPSAPYPEHVRIS